MEASRGSLRATSATKQQPTSPAPSRSSPWLAMDLHTTAPSTHRRAMYTPPHVTAQATVGGGGGGDVPPWLRPTNGAQAASSSPAFGPRRLPEGEAPSGLTARNIMIRRKLMERKRFDSADYAMKKMLAVLDAPSTAAPASEAAPAALLRATSPRTVATTHGSVGATVFRTALRTGHESGDAEDVLMADALVAEAADTSGARERRPLPGTRPLSPAVTSAAIAAARARSPSLSGYGQYGALVNASANGALSARNVLIQKKLREKRHFDSADYQLAQYNKTSSPHPEHRQDLEASVSPEGVSPRDRSPSPMDLDGPVDVTKPVNSPSAVGLAASHRREGVAQMSPSAARAASPWRDTTVDSQSATSLARTTVSERQATKYAGLSGANELLQRKLAEKKRFDSADYQMNLELAHGQRAGRAVLREQAQQQQPYQRFSDAPGHSGATMVFQPPPAPMNQVGAFQTPLQAAAMATPPATSSKYGKLCAANVMLRKKLKERKRFDSADYHMQRVGRSDEYPGSIEPSTTPAVPTPATATAVPTTATKYGTLASGNGHGSLNPAAKHIKLSADGLSWRPVVMVDRSPAPATHIEPGPSSGSSQDSRLVARNIMIHRKLAERKRFDSADYFAAKEAAK